MPIAPVATSRYRIAPPAPKHSIPGAYEETLLTKAEVVAFVLVIFHRLEKDVIGGKSAQRL